MRTSTRDIGTPQRDPGQQDLHRVFISYSRSDFYFAEQLAGALRRRGFAVWFDVHELGPGTDWSSAIDRAIAECDTFLVVASRAALESPYVQQERDRAVELTRSCIAVLPRRLGSADIPTGPTYDLASSFRRGVDEIAADLTAGRPRGWRPRLPLPFPASVLLVALAPVLATLLAVVMGTSFARAVAGQLIAFIPNGTWAVAVAVSMIALVGVYSAYCSWAFIMRRSSWLNVRGFQFTMPLIALLAVVTVDTMAGYINEPWIFALGGEAEETYLGEASSVLAVGVVLASAAAAIITSYAAGPCRHLKTGIAPERVRRRHIGPVPGSVEIRPPARSYRLIAAEDDSPVADEVRRALAGVGMAEVGDDAWSDRQIVVTSDRTPTEWLARDELKEPLAVVATSIDLPVRGVLQRFQWVDYRRRR
ncbi:MAG TPA: toll/interleukin-1 receptor domain-containing protein, partial [Acidimicrobiia bacterium]|nr:toll/interleukin-1 receptor domain-containing protein [Acidimicrobiia bacterium]